MNDPTIVPDGDQLGGNAIIQEPTADDFFSALYDCDGSALIELRFLPSKQQVFVPSNDQSRRREVLRDKCENCYFGVASRRNSDNGTAENSALLSALFADIDFKDSSEGEARAVLTAFPLRPSIVVNSGGGLQVYWLLREPLGLDAAADREVVASLLRRLAAALGADPHSTDVARILRVPGTFNLKYTPARPVQIAFLDGSRRYNPSDFDEFLPADPKAAPHGRVPVTTDAVPEGSRNAHLTSLAGAMRRRGMIPEAMAAALQVENAHRCDPPLAREEVDRIAASVGRYPPVDSTTPDTALDTHDGAEPNPKRNSQATTIASLVLDAECDLWHTPGGDAFITIPVGGHREHHALHSRGTRDYLTRLFYLDTHKAPNASALQDAIATLSGMARFDGAEHEVFVRVAGDAGDEGPRLYLDLCDPGWRSVEITPKGWHITTTPRVRFRRRAGLRPLPAPVRGGSLAMLRPFINVASDDDFILAVAWLLAALRSCGPYPILAILGEQGTAKTTTARVLRRLVDPSKSDMRAEPGEPRDVMVAATSSHVVALDNVSRLPDWLSDGLCRLSTGGGFSTRALYTDEDEIIFEATKPVIVTGITSVVTRGDLLDRSLVLTLPVITDTARRSEADFWGDFELAKPTLLGALLDAVVVGLGRQRAVKLARTPRMADFAIWISATEPACPWEEGAFMAAYASQCQDVVEVTLDGDIVADTARALAPWAGTATEFLADVNRRATDEQRRRKEWFTRPKQVADALRRLAPALRRVGVDVSSARQPHSRVNAGMDWFVTDRFFVRPVVAEYFRDPFQNFAHRWTIGAAVGYQLVDTPRVSWEVNGGPAYQHTTFESVAEGESRDESTAAMWAGTTYTNELTKDIDYTMDYRFLVVKPEAGRYTHHFLTGLAIEALGPLDVNLSFVWDRVQRPRPAASGAVPKKDDYRFIVGFGFDF